MFPDHSYRISRDFFQEVGSNIDTYLDLYSYGSKTLDWFPMDSKERFSSNLIKHKYSQDPLINRTLEYYLDNPISYVTNKVGFRDEDLDKKPEEVDVILGCSYSFGIGLHLENTWGHKLSSYLNFPTINASIPGSGPITHFRVLVQLSNQFKIRRVYHFRDISHNRVEWYRTNITHPDKSGYKNILTHDIPSYSDDPNVIEFLLENVFNEKNRTLLQLITKYGIEGFCKFNNINLVTGYYSEILDYLKLNQQDSKLSSEFFFNHSNNLYARDLVHASVEENHYIFLLFLSRLGIKVFED